MADNNEYVITLGAELDERSFEQQMQSLGSKLKNVSKKNKTVKIDVEFDKDSDIARAVSEINKLKKRFPKMEIDIEVNKALDGISNLRKKIEIIKTDFSAMQKKIAIDPTVNKSIEKTIKEIEELYSFGKQYDFDSVIDELTMKMNSVQVAMRKVNNEESVNAKVKKDDIELQKKLNQSIVEYKASLEALAALEIRRNKEEARVGSNKLLLDTEASKKYREELSKAIKTQEEDVVSKRKTVEQLGGAEKAAIAYEEKIRKVSLAQSEMNATGKNTLTFLQQVQTGFKDAFSRITNYTIAYKVLDVVTDKLWETIQLSKELDATMTDLRIVTGGTLEETEKLMGGYSSLATELGVTTQQVAEAANEFLRMGYEGEAANELIKNSTSLAVLGMIEQEEATQYLIAAMKGYGVEASKVSNIVDMATAVDLKYAVSSGYILEAMSRTAASAKLAGVEMSNLMGIISIVGETTQKSAEIIGESLKTAFARFSNVKVGKVVDAENPDLVEGINDIEKALNSIGISIRNQDGSWRRYEDVLDDVGMKFNDLEQTEKNLVATAMFGTVQRENGTIMLTKYKDIVEATAVAENAEGDAAKRMLAYNDSLQASINRVTVQFEKLVLAFKEGEIIKTFYNVLESLLTLLNNEGVRSIATLTVGLIALKGVFTVMVSKVIPSIITGLTGVSTVVKMVTADFVAGKLAVADLNAALELLGINPIVLALMALSAALYGLYKLYDYLNITLDEHIDKLNELSSEYNSIISDLKETESKLEAVGKRIDDINNKDTLSFTDEEELKNLQKQEDSLKRQLEYYEALERMKKREIYEEAAKTYTSQYATNGSGSVLGKSKIFGGYTSSVIQDVGSYISGEQEFNIASFTKEQGIRAYADMLQIYTEDLKDAEKEQQDAMVLFEQGTISKKAVDELDARVKEVKGKLKIAEDYVKDAATQLGKATENLEYIPEPKTEDERNVNKLIELYNYLQDAIIEANPSESDLGTGATDSLENQVKAGEKAESTWDKQIEKLENVKNAYGDLSEIVEAYNSSEGLTLDMLINLMEHSDEYAKYLTLEGDQLKINEQAMIDDAIAALQLADAELAIKQTDLVKSYIDQSGKLKDLTVDTNEQTKAANQLAIANEKLLQTEMELGNISKDALAEVRSSDAYKSLSAERAALEAQIKALEKYKPGSGGLGKTLGSSNKKSNKDAWKDAFDAEYDALKHKLNMEEISEKEYYETLDKLYKKYFAGRKKYEEEYNKYEEEVYKGRKKLAEKEYEDKVKNNKFAISLLENEEKTVESIEKQITLYRQMQADAHEEAERLRALGIEANKNEIFELGEDWWEYYNNIKKLQEEKLQLDVDAYKKVVETNDYYNRWNLSEKLVYLEKEKKAIEDKYSDMIITKEKYADAIADIDKEIYNTAKELAQEEVDQMETYLDYVNDVIDREIEKLEKQKEALKESNDERERAIKLAELEEKLAAAKRKNVLVYRKGKGFVYEEDKTAVREAQKNLDEYKAEQQLKAQEDAIQNAIDGWEKYRKEWNDTVDDYKKEQNRLIGLQYTGRDTEKDILDKRIKNVRQFARDYIDAMDRVNEYEGKQTVGDEEEDDYSSGGSYGKVVGKTDYGSTIVEADGKKSEVWVSGGRTYMDGIDIGDASVGEQWGIGSSGSKKSSGSKSSGKKSSGSKSKGSKSSNNKSKDKYSDLPDYTYSGEKISDETKKLMKELIDKGYASGSQGITESQIGLVGEKGAELRLLPKGTGIVPNQQTRTLMSFANDPTGFINNAMMNPISKSECSNIIENYEISGNIYVEAEDVEGLLDSFKRLKNKAVQKNTSRK